jgi:hypothetical protein
VFESQWQCLYPRPYKLIYAQGNAFTSNEFQELLYFYKNVLSPTINQNLQVNSILERVHQVIGNLLCTSDLTDSLWIDLGAICRLEAHLSAVSALASRKEGYIFFK